MLLGSSLRNGIALGRRRDEGSEGPCRSSLPKLSHDLLPEFDPVSVQAIENART